MERRDSIYTPKNIITLVAIFSFIFWLLYSLAILLHQSKKTNDEIQAIRFQNEKNLEMIEVKKQKAAYLQTPERIDKEAKMQMGRKQPGENVLVLVPEKLDIIPSSTEKRDKQQVARADVPILDKWKWVFWGKQ